jgi:hypothetical protein
VFLLDFLDRKMYDEPDMVGRRGDVWVFVHRN